MPSLANDSITQPEIATVPVPGARNIVSIEPAELAAAAGAGLMLLILRWLYHYSHSWNSDEPQHLHVVWAWTVGLLPYRDFFDNHTPLFHLLMSPVFHWLGERADIVFPMRLAMFPFFAISLWCVYRLGSRLYSPRVGLWGALLAGSSPDFFFLMGEFRTDVLWATLWLLTLVVMCDGPMTARRAFFAGVIFGTAFGVSMKSTVLLLTLLVAGAVTWFAYHRSKYELEPPSRRRRAVLGRIASGVAGFLIVPAAIVAYFEARDALQPLYECVIRSNMLPGENLALTILGHLFSRSSLVVLPTLAVGAGMIPLLNLDLRRWLPRFFLLQVTGLFYPLLQSFWPVLTAQDFLPWVPLLALHLSVALCFFSEKLLARYGQPFLRFALPLIAVIGAMGWTLARESCTDRHHNDRRIEALAAVLQLAEPGRYVMDAKGETIFRPRPCYPILERLTLRRLEIGDLKDEIVPRLIETRTAIARLSERIPKKTQQFILQNYLPVGHARVLGKKIAPDVDGVVRFGIEIPERYTFLSAAKPLSEGRIDGQPLARSCWLDRGQHELQLPRSRRDLALIWSRAQELGFSPP